MAKASTQVNTWEAELLKSATIATKSEANSIAHPTISMAGGMSYQGAKLPNDEMAAIILDSVHLNLYYPGAYNSDTPSAPTCYAFGRTNEEGKLEGVDTWNGSREMGPHKDCAATKQHTDCASCPMNQWSSADRGKGKACQNTRRLGMIPAGTLVDGRFTPYTKPEQIAAAQVAYLKVPPTSGKEFAAFVVQTANALARPLWGIFSRVKRVAYSSYFKIEFLPLASIPNTLMEATFKRQQEVKDDICYPFQPQAANVAPLAPQKKLRKYS